MGKKIELLNNEKQVFNQKVVLMLCSIYIQYIKFHDENFLKIYKLF